MKYPIRKILIGLIVVIVLTVILMRGDQLVELAQTMRKGAVVPLVLAVVTQLCKYYCQSWSYHYSFKAVGELMSPCNTLPLVFGAFFMNTIAPSLNMAGATLVVDDARRRGIPVGKATSAALLMQMTIESGFMVIMIVGFTVLQFAGQLSPIWFLAGLVVVALVGFMGGIMFIGGKSPQMLIKALQPIEGLVNRVLVKVRRNPLDPWVEHTVQSFGEAGRIIASRPKTAAAAFGCSIGASTCELAAFCLCGVSFGILEPEVLLCGYVVATLFAMISPVPQGVGIVEAAVMVLFGAYSVNVAAGMAAVLVYRGLVFWMPFLIGAVLIQRTKVFEVPEGAKKGLMPDGERIISMAASDGPQHVMENAVSYAAPIGEMPVPFARRSSGKRRMADGQEAPVDLTALLAEGGETALDPTPVATLTTAEATASFKAIRTDDSPAAQPEAGAIAAPRLSIPEIAPVEKG